MQTKVRMVEQMEVDQLEVVQMDMVQESKKNLVRFECFTLCSGVERIFSCESRYNKLCLPSLFRAE